MMRTCTAALLVSCTVSVLIVHSNANRAKRNAVRSRNLLWNGGLIPYEIKQDYGPFMEGKIRQAMDAFERDTCIRFKQRTNENDYILITWEKFQCYSSRGKRGGMQIVAIVDPGCGEVGEIQHELMHAVGFAHEHQRFDASSYVTVNEDNIEDGKENQFQPLSRSALNNQNLPYDFASIMHYPGNFFAKDSSRNTLSALPNFKQFEGQMGQRAGFSQQDIQEINVLYQCPPNSGRGPGWSGTNGGGGGIAVNPGPSGLGGGSSGGRTTRRPFGGWGK